MTPIGSTLCAHSIRISFEMQTTTFRRIPSVRIVPIKIHYYLEGYR